MFANLKRNACTSFLATLLTGSLYSPALATPAAFDLERFAAAQRQLQASLRQDQQAQDTTQTAELYLRPHYASHMGLLPPETAKATVLLFHGYTAGPWQLPELGQRLNAAGFHYLAPRQPGHGWMTPARLGTGQRMVSFAERQRYDDFVQQVYAQVQGLQVPVYTVGLSGGGNLALRLAELQPEITRAVAVAPFLGPDYPAAWGYLSLEALNALSFGGLVQALQTVPYNENTLSEPAETLPHTQGHLNQAYTSLKVGEKVQALQASVQFFTTADDGLSGVDPVGVLFRRLGGEARHGWYHYRAAEGMPHAMISPQQHDPAAVAELHRMIVHFLSTGQRFWRPPTPPDWYCQRVRRADTCP